MKRGYKLLHPHLPLHTLQFICLRNNLSNNSLQRKRQPCFISRWCLLQKGMVVMKKKSAIAIALAATLLLPTNAYALSVSDFSDFPSDWSTQALTNAVNNGLLNGTDGRINASGMLTRAEMAAIVNRAFGAINSASLADYTDVSPDAWYYEDMAKAVQMGTFQGANHRLNPTDPITREQAFAVLARAFLLEDGDVSALTHMLTEQRFLRGHMAVWRR